MSSWPPGPPKTPVMATVPDNERYRIRRDHGAHRARCRTATEAVADGLVGEHRGRPGLAERSDGAHAIGVLTRELDRESAKQEVATFALCDATGDEPCFAVGCPE